jgi:hypothetical protein
VSPLSLSRISELEQARSRSLMWQLIDGGHDRRARLVRGHRASPRRRASRHHATRGRRANTSRASPRLRPSHNQDAMRSRTSTSQGPANRRDTSNSSGRPRRIEFSRRSLWQPFGSASPHWQSAQLGRQKRASRRPKLSLLKWKKYALANPPLIKRRSVHMAAALPNRAFFFILPFTGGVVEKSNRQNSFAFLISDPGTIASNKRSLNNGVAESNFDASAKFCRSLTDQDTSIFPRKFR